MLGKHVSAQQRVVNLLNEDGNFKLPDACTATWVSALKELESSLDGDRAASRYQFAAGYLQALHNVGAIDEATYGTMRQHLLQVWSGLCGAGE